jgi:hypothetical protein
MVRDDVGGNSGTLASWSLAIESGERSTTTGANGDYHFQGLPAGNYVVAELMPAGWEQTSPGAVAPTNLIANGGFETGDLTGWTVQNSGPGSFVINDGSVNPASPDGPLPPLNGNHSALSNQSGPGTYMIYQDVTIPAGSQLMLEWAHRIRNHATAFQDPNQEYRVEIRTMSGQSITVFSTNPGNPRLQGWTVRTANLAAFAGQTIRIAFVVQNDLFFFNVHLDIVRIEYAANVGAIPVAITAGQNVSSIDFGNRLLLPGDYSLDGVVDTADYVYWRRTVNSTVPAFSGADGSGNGFVDAADYDVWRANFGNTASSSAGAGAEAVAASSVATPAATPAAYFTAVSDYGAIVAKDEAIGTLFAVPADASSAKEIETSDHGRVDSSARYMPSAPTPDLLLFALHGQQSKDRESIRPCGASLIHVAAHDLGLAKALDDGLLETTTLGGLMMRERFIFVT